MIIITTFFVSIFEMRNFVSNIETMRKSLYSNQNDALTSWLKQKRTEKGLTMRQLGALLDVHHSIIGKIETGQRRLDVVEFVKYCEILEADPHEGLAIIK